MTVEEIRSPNGDYDDFPVGMRVLAVDDDPICLKLLDTLLKKCQYHVTTTSRARVALNMLRENKDRFDLVISDVHMPDMDGFKLLELVGLEMDLPVIMLSANGDPKLVMKGVTHGACDYLVKPIRIEELRNIWQHVIRKKKIDPKSSSDQDKTCFGNVEGAQGVPLTSADQSGRVNKKRKDDKDEAEENENENEDPATQKKPRVVWSIELHRKFVSAVNQLGIDKAVPKRILDMMNVEGISRENVASHLQKYRLYLKRISSSVNQQANRVAILGSRDPPYMRMGSFDGLGDFRSLAGSGRLTNTILSPYSPSGMLGRLNSPVGVNLHNFTSPALIQPSHGQNFSNPINSFGKLSPVVTPASQKENLTHGASSLLELDQSHQSKCTTRLGDFTRTDESRIFTNASTFPDNRVTVGSLNNNVNCAATGPSLNGGGFGNQSFFNNASFNSDSFSIGADAQLSNFQSNLSPLIEPLDNGHLPLGNVRENHSSAVSNLMNPLDFSSTNIVSGPGGLNCLEEGFVSDVVTDVNQLQSQRWGAHEQNYSLNSDNVFSNLNSQLPGNNGTHNMDQGNMRCFSGDASMLLQSGDVEKSNTELTVRSNENCLLGQTKPQGAFAAQNYDSLDDFMSTMIKREQDGAMLDGQFGYNHYSFGSCM